MINLDTRIIDELDECEMHFILKIAKRMKHNRMTAWPSLETLCKDCKWSPNTVRAVRKRLVERGFLVVQHREGASPIYSFKKTGISIFSGVDSVEMTEEYPLPKNGTPTKKRPLPKNEHDPYQKLVHKVVSKEVIRNVVSPETTAFSSPLESELSQPASDAAGGAMISVTGGSETSPPPAESASDTRPGGTPTARHAYTPDFEAFWKAYNYCAGSKLTASKRWERLSAKEKSLASDALSVHLRASTTDKARRKDTPFLPMRCHAAVYLSEKRWEAYGEKTETQRSDNTVTAWDEKYQIYLRTCQNKWPDTLASIAYLSKPEYCAFQDRKYIQGIGRIGEKMQIDRLTRCHDRWESGEPSARNYQSVWAYFLNEMANCIKQSNSI